MRNLVGGKGRDGRGVAAGIPNLIERTAVIACGGGDAGIVSEDDSPVATPGTRVVHAGAGAIEMADQLGWAAGSGYPKNTLASEIGNGLSVRRPERGCDQSLKLGPGNEQLHLQ